MGKIYPVVRYKTLIEGKLGYHHAYNLGPIEYTNLANRPEVIIIYPK